MTPYYMDESVTIYHGDAREVLSSIGKVDLLCTDAPYGVGVDYEAKGEHGEFTSRGGGPKQGPRKDRNMGLFSTDQDWASVRRLVRCVAQRIESMHLTDRASCYWWLGHRSLTDLVDIYEARGWSTRPIVWGKPDAPPAMPGSGWKSMVELGLYAYRPGRVWNHHCNAPGNLLTTGSVRGDRDHPTQKPLDLMGILISSSSHAGDTVLDPFAGSGTTLDAARRLGRRAIGIEIEERWCEAMARRMSQQLLPVPEVAA